MRSKEHESAKASHYDKGAEHYDLLNEDGSKIINQVIEEVLREAEVKSVLDMTCGTGSQVCYLAEQGYEVVGSDINRKMLDVASRKTNVELIEGDMRNLKVGTFDAVITIFNAVGHLTKEDFERAMQNVRDNLKEGGLYVFDIFNLESLLEGDHICRLTIDWLREEGDEQVRDIQYSTINEEGVLASYTTSYVGEEMSTGEQTLQVYRKEQLEEMLSRNGFEVSKCCNPDGSEFVPLESERILLVAKKKTLYQH